MQVCCSGLREFHMFSSSVLIISDAYSCNFQVNLVILVVTITVVVKEKRKRDKDVSAVV